MQARAVAITGLDTFVGLRMAERLLDSPSPPQVVGLDLRVPRRLEGRIRFHRVDLTEPAADSLVAELLAKEGCEALLHTAFFSRPHADTAYAHELEVIGSLHVMNATASAQLRKLVVMSTAQVYGAAPDNPHFLTESAPLRAHPDSHGVRDRVEMEQLLALFAERHPKITCTALRPCWVVGPTIDAAPLAHFSGDRVTTLLGYDPLMQFLHEEDLLRAVELALTREAPGPFNLAGNGVLPLSMLLRMAGKRPMPVPHPLLYRVGYVSALWSAGDPPSGFYDYLRYLWITDTSRARERLGFEPEYTTKEAWMSHVVSRKLRRYR